MRVGGGHVAVRAGEAELQHRGPQRGAVRVHVHDRQPAVHVGHAEVGVRQRDHPARRQQRDERERHPRELPQSAAQQEVVGRPDQQHVPDQRQYDRPRRHEPDFPRQQRVGRPLRNGRRPAPPRCEELLAGVRVVLVGVRVRVLLPRRFRHPPPAAVRDPFHDSRAHPPQVRERVVPPRGRLRRGEVGRGDADHRRDPQPAGADGDGGFAARPGPELRHVAAGDGEGVEQFPHARVRGRGRGEQAGRTARARPREEGFPLAAVQTGGGGFSHHHEVRPAQLERVAGEHERGDAAGQHPQPLPALLPDERGRVESVLQRCPAGGGVVRAQQRDEGAVLLPAGADGVFAEVEPPAAPREEVEPHRDLPRVVRQRGQHLPEPRARPGHDHFLRHQPGDPLAA